MWLRQPKYAVEDIWNGGYPAYILYHWKGENTMQFLISVLRMLKESIMNFSQWLFILHDMVKFDYYLNLRLWEIYFISVFNHFMVCFFRLMSESQSSPLEPMTGWPNPPPFQWYPFQNPSSPCLNWATRKMIGCTSLPETTARVPYAPPQTASPPSCRVMSRPWPQVTVFRPWPRSGHSPVPRVGWSRSSRTRRMRMTLR